MIKPEELMIGNKVKSTGLLNGRILTVENITGRGTLLDQKRVVFFLEEKNVGDFCEDLEPIPLTEELLVKAGFRIHDDGRELKGNDRYYVHPKLVGCLSMNFTYSITRKKLDKLHKLQNLFYELEGTELTIKL